MTVGKEPLDDVFNCHYLLKNCPEQNRSRRAQVGPLLTTWA